MYCQNLVNSLFMSFKSRYVDNAIFARVCLHWLCAPGIISVITNELPWISKVPVKNLGVSITFLSVHTKFLLKYYFRECSLLISCDC